METGKTGKYLKYAIGEIVLVVIGILIALQINNWNLKNSERSHEFKYLEQMVLDLQKDSIALTNLSVETDKIHQSKNELFDILIQKKTSDSATFHFSNLWRLWNSFTPNRATIDEMLNSSHLKYIRDDSFKTKHSRKRIMNLKT